MIRKLISGAAVFALSVALTSTAYSQQDAPQPPQSPTQMDASKVGPQTEQVDAAAYAAVLHVAPSGSDQADGSKEKPLKSITQALAKAPQASEQKRVALFVAAGTYGEPDAIQLKEHVDLFGGFDAGNWQRDIAAHRTVIDGQGSRRLIIAANNSRIDGFVLQNGKVRGHGAAILCDHASPTITNNVIINNATLAPEALSGNTMVHQAGHEGAGIACMNGSSPTIANNVIAHNTTQIGGGGGITASNYSLPYILNNVIYGNETGLTDVKTRSSNGAAISFSHAPIRNGRQPAVINNVIANNRAGGGSDAGGIYCEYDSMPVIGANWVLGNQAMDDGGGIYVMKNSHPLITHNTIAGNNSSALRLSKEGRGDVENNLFFGNSSPLICISSFMRMKNNTIVDNRSGVSYGNTYAPHLKPSIITGNLIHANAGGSGFGVDNSGKNPDDLPTVTNNDIQGGYAGGEGNFDEKPQFVDDAVQGQASAAQYDEQRSVTTIQAKGLSAGQNLAGRVIQLGEKWSIVKEASADKIVAWGDLRAKDGAQADQFKVWPTYTLRTALAGAAGRQVSSSSE